jgi:hypothetical protein
MSCSAARRPWGPEPRRRPGPGSSTLTALKAAVTELEIRPYSEDPWSKLVEAITVDQTARAFPP